MRDIECRVWDKINKKMQNVDGDCLYISNGKIYEIYEGYFTFPNNITSIKRDVTELYELMQYTGLNDKNGVKIFEGDIYHQGDKNIKYVVVWHDTGLIGKQIGSSSYAGLSYWQDRIAVIGNIYENPELIVKNKL